MNDPVYAAWGWPGLKGWHIGEFTNPDDEESGAMPPVPPFPMTFGLMTAPKWVQENTFAWHRMTHETEWYRMNTGRPIDLKATATRVFRTVSRGQVTAYAYAGSVPDRHPDSLYEFTHHGRVCPQHWFMVVAMTSTGLTTVLSVNRVQDTEDGTEKYSGVMRPGYAHPSEEYACEIARQVHACERDAFAWDATSYRWHIWPVSHTVVYERIGTGWDPDSWREVRSYNDNNNRITNPVVPDTETT